MCIGGTVGHLEIRLATAARRGNDTHRFTGSRHHHRQVGDVPTRLDGNVTATQGANILIKESTVLFVDEELLTVGIDPHRDRFGRGAAHIDTPGRGSLIGITGIVIPGTAAHQPVGHHLTGLVTLDIAAGGQLNVAPMGGIFREKAVASVVSAIGAPTQDFRQHRWILALQVGGKIFVGPQGR